MRRVAAVPALVVITAAGVGWLYLLRDAGALALGPRVPEALPLQRLAHGDAQPLARLVAAWLPAGIVAGLALPGVRPAVRALVAFGVVFAVLIVSGASLDALTVNERMASHLGAQPGRAATWLAAALVALGTLVTSVPRRRAVVPETPAGATRLGMGRTAAP